VEEGILFARGLDQASHGLVRRLFGPRYDYIIGRLPEPRPRHVLPDGSIPSARTGRSSGLASTYTAEEHAHAIDGPVPRGAGVRMLRMIPIWIRGRALFEFINAVPEGDYYLAAVAVDEGHRGSGIGSILLNDAEDHAAKSGCTRLAPAAPDHASPRNYATRCSTQQEW
jgi:GNAT superfamily N-acetyltransferase